MLLKWCNIHLTLAEKNEDCAQCTQEKYRQATQNTQEAEALLRYTYSLSRAELNELFVKAYGFSEEEIKS
jgi:hypothetical protein